jgi:hypothetical protein
MAPHRAPPPPRGHHDANYGHDMAATLDGHGMRHGPMTGRSSGSTWRSADGRTTVVTHGGAHVAGHGYGTAGGPVIVAPAGAVTTVTIASAPVVTTTTTTEYYEDRVTYTRAPVAKRKVYTTKRVWRAKAKPRCICR